jgi:hypothetical protein
MSGVKEEAAEFSRPFDLKSDNRFRRIAGIGPVYEALEDKGAFVRVRVLGSDEEFDYSKAEAELDPQA